MPDQTDGPISTPASSGSHRWIGDPAWDLQRLWLHGSKPRQWIVRPLIAEGDQIILAGEPKAGKSLIASQLCLEIANGRKVLSISLPDAAKTPGEKLEDGPPIGRFDVQRKNPRDKSVKWVVLYVSFEMGSQIMWARAEQQAMGLGIDLLTPSFKPRSLPPEEYVRDTYKAALSYYHLFELRGGRTLGINPMFKDLGQSRIRENVAIRNEWQGVLDTIKPDLIIFDSLSQLHFCDENSNLEMRDALQQLRRFCVVNETKGSGPETTSYKRAVAHIIIHHTRKEGGDQKYARKDASEMRGASSIHSEADLAITITKRHTNGDEISLSFSSRHSARLPDLRLRRNGQTATYNGTVPPEPPVLTVSKQLFEILEKRKLTVEELAARHEKRFKVKKDGMKGNSWWEKVLKKLVDLKALTKSRGVRGKPATFEIAKGIKAKDWVHIVTAIYSNTKTNSQKVGKSA